MRGNLIRWYIVFLVTILMVLCGVYMFVIKPLTKSRAAYNEAHIYEIQQEYELAIKSYSDVSEMDIENYYSSQSRIQKLEYILNVNQMAAKGYLMLQNDGYIRDESMVSEIGVNIESQSFSCRIDGIGYFVSKEEVSKSGLYSVYKSSNTENYITVFTPEKLDQGTISPLLSDWYESRSDTSDLLYRSKTILMDSEWIDWELMEKYIAEYKAASFSHHLFGEEEML